MSVFTISNVSKRLLVDLYRCKGSTVICSQGKRYIDLHTNIGSLPLGYNHEQLLKVTETDIFKRNITSRQQLNLYPTMDFVQIMSEVVPKFTPIQEDPFVFLTSSGSEAVESAIKLCLHYRHGSIGSLQGGFHGRTLGALSLTNTDPVFNYNFPRLPYQHFPFPNENNMLSILRSVEEEMQKGELSAFFLEPIQGEGGERFIPPEFYFSLRKLCLRHSVPFVVDEIQTGMGTGELWAHKAWNLCKEPDIVLFSKKCQMSGLVSQDYLRPRNYEYNFNSTWPGDVSRILFFNKIYDIIEEQGLYKKQTELGEYFFNHLRSFPVLSNVRNKGFYGAFDVTYRDSFVKLMMQHRVILSGCGPSSVRIRPTLIMTKSEVDEALTAIDKVLRLYQS